MGPTNQLLSISPDVNNPAFAQPDLRRAARRVQDAGAALIDGGCDLLLFETIVDTLNAKAGIVAIEEVFEETGVRLPLMISVTITDRSGRTLSGQTIDAFWASSRAREAVQRRHQLRARRAGHAAVRRGAGAHRRPATSAAIRTPACRTRSASTTSSRRTRAARLRGVRRQRLRQHRRRLLRHDARSHPRDRAGGRGAAAADAIHDSDSHSDTALTQFAGLETLTIRPDSNFQMIGERTNVTGSAKFARLIKTGDYAEATRVALDQVRGGANLIDVNMDEGMLDSEQAMTRFLNYIATEPEIARVPGR